MLQKLTYKTKNRLLLIASILLAFASYQLSFKKTIEAYRACTNSEAKLELASNAPELVNELENKVAKMNALLGNQNKDNKLQEQALLELVTHYCQENDAVLRDFPQNVSSLQEHMLVTTNRFVVEAKFATLVKLVYLLEQKNNLGKVVSVRYQYKKDNKTREMALTATIYLQNIKRNSDEK